MKFGFCNGARNRVCGDQWLEGEELRKRSSAQAVEGIKGASVAGKTILGNRGKKEKADNVLESKEVLTLGTSLKTGYQRV